MSKTIHCTAIAIMLMRRRRLLLEGGHMFITQKLTKQQSLWQKTSSCDEEHSGASTQSRCFVDSSEHAPLAFALILRPNSRMRIWEKRHRTRRRPTLYFGSCELFPFPPLVARRTIRSRLKKRSEKSSEDGDNNFQFHNYNCDNKVPFFSFQTR